MSVCLLCNESSGEIANVATCSNRCDIFAHESCFKARKSTTIFRRKHHDRGNHDSEVCLASGCCGKFIPRRTSVEKSVGEPLVSTKSGASLPRESLDDPDHPCSFMGRDGLPCRRPAIRNGACRVHSRNADLMRRMMQDVEREDRNKGVMTDTVSTVCVAVQTTATKEGRSNDDITELQRNMEAVIRHYQSNTRDTSEVETLKQTNASLMRRVDEMTSRIAALESERTRLSDSLKEAARLYEGSRSSHESLKRAMRELAQSMLRLTSS